MGIICRRFKFAAAHLLPKYKGKCHNLHGHQWFIDIGISGPIKNDNSPENGMIMDFIRLKRIVTKEILDIVDHKYLNEIFPSIDPTAENMSRLFFEILEVALKNNEPNIKLEFIKVWETENAYAEWRSE